MNALDYAIRVLGLLTEVIAAGMEVAAFIRQTEQRMTQMRDEKRDPTDAEWRELNDQIAALREQLHRPLNVQ